MGDAVSDDGKYDLNVYSTNGFLRTFKGRRPRVRKTPGPQVRIPGYHAKRDGYHRHDRKPQLASLSPLTIIANAYRQRGDDDRNDTWSGPTRQSRSAGGPSRRFEWLVRFHGSSRGNSSAGSPGRWSRPRQRQRSSDGDDGGHRRSGGPPDAVTSARRRGVRADHDKGVVFMRRGRGRAFPPRVRSHPRGLRGCPPSQVFRYAERRKGAGEVAARPPSLTRRPWFLPRLDQDRSTRAGHRLLRQNPCTTLRGPDRVRPGAGRLSPRLVMDYFKERSDVMLRSLLAAIVVVQIIALALILLLKPAPGVVIGLAILVACPAAPLMLSTAPQKGGASAPFMASLHLSLAVLAILTVPVVISLLSRPLGFRADVDMGVMAWMPGQDNPRSGSPGVDCPRLVPRARRQGRPRPRQGGQRRVDRRGAVVLRGVLSRAAEHGVVELCGHRRRQRRSAGHRPRAAAHRPHEKTALAVECAVRHPALAITIGAMNFSLQRTLPVLVPCLVTFIAVAMVYMFLRKSPIGSGPPDPPSGLLLG